MSHGVVILPQSDSEERIRDGTTAREQVVKRREE